MEFKGKFKSVPLLEFWRLIDAKMGPIILGSLLFPLAGYSEQLPLKLVGIQSPYSDRVKAWIKKPTSASKLKLINKDYRLQCYGLKENEFYVGAEQHLEITANLVEVAKILDDLSIYPKIFDDLIRAEEKARKGNQWVVYSEQHIAIPFIPNERTEMLYWLETDQMEKRIYRYQLMSSNHLKANDGAIILEQVSPQLTHYSEVDFLDIDLGLSKAFGSKRVWKDSLEGLLQSDFAVKLKAEHPDWENRRILEESRNLSKEVNVDKCLNDIIEFHP